MQSLWIGSVVYGEDIWADSRATGNFVDKLSSGGILAGLGVVSVIPCSIWPFRTRYMFWYTR